MNEERQRRLRNALLRLIVGVVVVDAIGMGLLYFGKFPEQSNGRTLVIGFWLLATLLVVIPGLRAIRGIRRER